tara:strand:- start:92 stop:313 length:222 start_codon:yes stop_codon:yes gene_type:complete
MFNEVIMLLIHLAAGNHWVGVEHARGLVLLVHHGLFVLVVNEHLVLGVLLDKEHFLLLATQAMVALREGAVLV